MLRSIVLIITIISSLKMNLTDNLVRYIFPLLHYAFYVLKYTLYIGTIFCCWCKMFSFYFQQFFSPQMCGFIHTYAGFKCKYAVKIIMFIIMMQERRNITSQTSLFLPYHTTNFVSRSVPIGWGFLVWSLWFNKVLFLNVCIRCNVQCSENNLTCFLMLTLLMLTRSQWWMCLAWNIFYNFLQSMRFSNKHCLATYVIHFSTFSIEFLYKLLHFCWYCKTSSHKTHVDWKSKQFFYFIGWPREYGCHDFLNISITPALNNNHK